MKFVASASIIVRRRLRFPASGRDRDVDEWDGFDASWLGLGTFLTAVGYPARREESSLLLCRKVGRLMESRSWGRRGRSLLVTDARNCRGPVSLRSWWRLRGVKGSHCWVKFAVARAWHPV